MPKLSWDAEPDDARAVALVLHGGRSRSTAPTRATQLAVLRMAPFASRLAHDGRGLGLAVARLRFEVRGWNGAERSPVADAQWALAQIEDRFGRLPVGLVGHSMGGRTAMYAAGFPTVRSVVGLAPWLEPGDPVAGLAGRRVLIVHGDSDRMTSPPASLAYARELRGIAESVAYVSLRGGRHAMLQRPGLWHGLAAGFTLDALLDATPEGTVDAHVANILLSASDGQQPVVA